MSLKREVLRGTIGSAIKSWGGELFGAGFFLTLLYLLDPADFGRLAMAGVIVAVGEIVVDLGLVEALVQRDSVSDGGFSGVFWTLIGAALICCALIWSISPLLDQWTGMNQVGLLSGALSLSYLFSNAGLVHQARLKRDLSFNRLAVCSITATIGAGVTAVGMAWWGWGVWSLIVREVLYDGIHSGTMAVADDWTPGFSVNVEELRELASFGSRIIGSRGANFFQTRTDDFVIGLFLGPTLLGVYSVGYKMFLMVHRLINQSLDRVALPAFSRIQDDLQRVRSNLYRVVRLTSIVGGLVYGLIVVLGADTVRLLLKAEWQQSGVVLQLLAIAGFLHTVSSSNRSVLLSLNHPTKKMVLSWVNAGLNVTAFAIGARFGIYGIATAYVISEYIHAPIIYGVLWFVVSFQWRQVVGELLPSILATGLMIGTTGGLRYGFFHHPGYLEWASGLFVATGIYGLTIFLFYPERWEELFELLQNTAQTLLE